MKRALLLAAALLLPAFDDPTPLPYFASVAHRDSQQASFREDWFGRPLRAMGEPVFSRTDGAASPARRLRLLVRPARGPIYAIRLDQDPGGRNRLTITILNGHSFRRDGRVTARRMSMLSRTTLAEIHDAAMRADLAVQPADGTNPPPRRLPDGSSEILECTHSTNFVFEAVDPGGTYFLQRDPCTITREQAALAYTLVRLRADAPAADIAILAEAMRRE